MLVLVVVTDVILVLISGAILGWDCSGVVNWNWW